MSTTTASDPLSAATIPVSETSATTATATAPGLLARLFWVTKATLHTVWMEAKARVQHVLSPAAQRAGASAKQTFARGRTAARATLTWLTSTLLTAGIVAGGFMFEGWEFTAGLGIALGYFGWGGVGMILLFVAACSLALRHHGQQRRAADAADDAEYQG